MRLNSLNLKNISIHDPFWSKHVDLVRNAIIPYQWEAMNDRIPDAESSHCLENFEIAAGRKTGEFYGAVFQDTDVAKWLEAVGFSLACYPDEALEKTADEVIDLIAEAQCEDGYINTYYTIKEPGKRWTDLCEGHELYTAGHLIEAAVAYYEGTGKKKFLDCVSKFADLICDTFGTEEGKIHGYPGHEEIELALAEAYQDEGLLNACKTLWNNIVQKRMYITGGIGSSGYLERFTVDYDLPNDSNYSESCASIGLALFGLRMAQITGESQYIDVAERALYNTVLAGIALDGKSFFYVNPLEVWPPACMEGTSKKHVKPIRQKWFGVACCPPNIARTLASLGQYIYAENSKKKELYVNLFVSNETELDWNENKISVKLQTEFPWVNTYSLEIKNVPEGEMDLLLRVPDYAQDYQVTADGNMYEENKELEKGYRRVHVEKDTRIEVSFAAPAKFVYANPQVRADSGKAAIVRGPLVYCLEEIDNSQNLPAVFVDTDTALEEEKSDLFGGIVTVKARGKKIVESSVSNSLYSGQKPQLEDVELTAIPYPYWNNRGEGEMLVWMKELRP